MVKDGQRYYFGKGEEVPFSSNLFHFLFDQVCTSTDILTNGLKELLKLLVWIVGLFVLLQSSCHEKYIWLHSLSDAQLEIQQIITKPKKLLFCYNLNKWNFCAVTLRVCGLCNQWEHLQTKQVFNSGLLQILSLKIPLNFHAVFQLLPTLFKINI